MNQLRLGAKRWMMLAITMLILLAGSIQIYQKVYATPPSGGITATPLGSGTLPEPIVAKFKEAHSGFGNGTNVSNIIMSKYVALPGASFGWHQHSGPIWVVMTAGTLTYYDVDGSECRAQAFSAGSAFFDPGNNTHIARNEGSETVELYATYMLPEGGSARIDVPDPGVCNFK